MYEKHRFWCMMSCIPEHFAHNRKYGDCLFTLGAFVVQYMYEANAGINLDNSLFLHLGCFIVHLVYE